MEYRKIDTLCSLFAKGIGLSILEDTFLLEYCCKSFFNTLPNLCCFYRHCLHCYSFVINKYCVAKSNIENVIASTLHT